MEATTSDKEELRRRLRNKIKTKNATRTNQQDGPVNASTTSESQKLATAQNALMAVAGDDPGLLRVAQSLMKNPKGAIDQLKAFQSSVPTPAASQEQQHKTEQDDSDEDEEAPNF